MYLVCLGILSRINYVHKYYGLKGEGGGPLGSNHGK